LKTEHQQFDFVFCDPPYDYEFFRDILQLIADQKLLTTAGVLIYESSARQTVPQAPGLDLIRQKKIGDTLITFYEEDYESSSLSRDI
jgi:16S rRNA (guanine966-N2)-methyltransferase